MSSPYFILWTKPNGHRMSTDERMSIFTLAERRGVRKTGDFNSFVADVYRAKIASLREEEMFYPDLQSRDRIRAEYEHYEKDLAKYEKEISNVPPTST